MACAVKIYDYLISNFGTFSHKLGFMFFRKSMSSFQTYGIPKIAKNLANLILKYSDDFQTLFSKPYDFEMFSISLKAFHNCMTFNFNLCFYENEIDSEVCETSLTSVFYRYHL